MFLLSVFLTLGDAFATLESDTGRVAEWSGTGLQNPSPRFNSGRDLKIWSDEIFRRNSRASGGIGRRSGLKIRGPQGHEGSSPSSPTEEVLL